MQAGCTQLVVSHDAGVLHDPDACVWCLGLRQKQQNDLTMCNRLLGLLPAMQARM